MSAEAVDPTPRRRRKIKGMEKEEMHDAYPSLRSLTGAPGKALERAWVATFNARPDAMQALLADYIKQVHAQPGRIGQRPMPRESDVDFHALVYGETTDEPLVEILPELVQGMPIHLRSERGFCAAINMSRTQYRRLRAGEYHPDVNDLRQIAKVLGKPPVFFLEYRIAMVAAAMIGLMEKRPGIATSLYRNYLDVQLGK